MLWFSGQNIAMNKCKKKSLLQYRVTERYRIKLSFCQSSRIHGIQIKKWILSASIRESLALIGTQPFSDYSIFHIILIVEKKRLLKNNQFHNIHKNNWWSSKWIIFCAHLSIIVQSSQFSRFLLIFLTSIDFPARILSHYIPQYTSLKKIFIGRIFF